MRFIMFNVLAKRIKAIRAMMMDKTVPKRKKLLIIFGIAYLIMPFDLVPIVLFFVAWIDDAILWIFILWHLKDTLDEYWIGPEEVDVKKKFKEKDIIDDVDFKVNKNNKK